MSKEQIETVQNWFDFGSSEERSFRTNYGNGEYFVADSDVGAFGDFISEAFPDLIGIACMVGKGGIWFWDSSLENAHFI